jgi:hypothetical protein
MFLSRVRPAEAEVHPYFEERLPLQASLPATVVREGVLLHAA